MAGQIRPATRPVHGRTVYVCLPASTEPAQHPRILAALEGVVRPSDRLLHHPHSNVAGPVIAYAHRHGHTASTIADTAEAPDLIVIIVDPLGDNSSALEARLLAARGASDIFITEMPDEP